ncbi:hypothetical protein MBANPS3_010378 [Mucor bainieri]
MAAVELFYNHLSIFLDYERKRQNQYFVKKLAVDEQWVYKGVPRDYAVLSALGCLCPNLVMIESNNPTDGFYETLLNLRQDGCLLKVEHISAPNHSHTRNYYKTMVAFKDTLVELLVNRNLNVDLPQAGSIKTAFEIAGHLGEFTCLKRLHVDLAQDVALHRIEELLALCANASMLEAVKVTMAIKKEEEAFQDDRMDVQHLSRLPSVKNFTLVNREHISIQDMAYIMQKFPGLKRLHSSTEGCYSEEPKIDLYATEVVHQFSRFISQLDRCHINLLKAAPALILDAITQLSKGFKVDDLTVNASDEVDDEKCAYLNILESTRVQKVLRTIQLILSTLHIDPLYQTTLEAFAPQIKKLKLYGTLNPKGARTYTTHFSNVQRATNSAISESMNFILSSFTCLKQLYLYNVIISTRLSASILIAKLRLDDLYIYQCALNPQTLHQFSQYLDYVERFRIKDVAFWISDDLVMRDHLKVFKIDMPYTAFGTVFLTDDNQAYWTGIKVCTDTTTKHYLHSRNSNGRCELTKQNYSEIKTLNRSFRAILVKCRHVAVIDLGCCRLPISDGSIVE